MTTPPLWRRGSSFGDHTAAKQELACGGRQRMRLRRCSSRGERLAGTAFSQAGAGIPAATPAPQGEGPTARARICTEVPVLVLAGAGARTRCVSAIPDSVTGPVAPRLGSRPGGPRTPSPIRRARRRRWCRSTARPRRGAGGRGSRRCRCAASRGRGSRRSRRTGWRGRGGRRGGCPRARSAGVQPRFRASAPAERSQILCAFPAAGTRSSAVPSPWVLWPPSRAAMTRRR